MTDKRSFKILPGGMAEVRVGPVSIAPVEEVPPWIDAIVVEEDTFYVLSAPPVVRPVEAHPIRVFDAIEHCESDEPGDYRLNRKTRPVRVELVVYDVSQSPMTREPWIQTCIESLLALAEREGWQALATPSLGYLYGAFSPQTYRAMLESTLEQSQPDILRTWCILV